MKFLIDECLHTSLVAVAKARQHQGWHVTWLGLGGLADWTLMERIVAEDFTLVTNNARDFRKLYAREPIHAGLIIIVPQVTPGRQRQLFDAVLELLGPEEILVNEIVEVEMNGEEVEMSRYERPDSPDANN